LPYRCGKNNSASFCWLSARRGKIEEGTKMPCGIGKIVWVESHVEWMDRLKSKVPTNVGSEKVNEMDIVFIVWFTICLLRF
jgi:hypothetical protein